MLNKYLFRRYLLFAIALFVNAMGIAYITKASLGTSPITSVTYVASMFTPLTMGQWTIVLNLLVLILAICGVAWLQAYYMDFLQTLFPQIKITEAALLPQKALGVTVPVFDEKHCRFAFVLV